MICTSVYDFLTNVILTHVNSFAIFSGPLLKKVILNPQYFFNNWINDKILSLLAVHDF